MASDGPASGNHQGNKAARVTLGELAHWDEAERHFHVLVYGSELFGALIVMENAPLPLDHLDTGAHHRTTPLGANLQERLESEVNGAISRGAHQVATGLFLRTHAEMASDTSR